MFLNEEFYRKTLSACLRLFDVVGRWGGDEFVAIIINVRKKQLHDTAQRFLSLIRSSSVPIERETLQVTVSLGTTLAKLGDTVESIIRRADSLMYQSKASAGDCISTGSGRRSNSSAPLPCILEHCKPG